MTTTPMTADEHLEHFGTDETGENIITFRGSIEIEDRCGFSTYAREVRFTTTHHVDPKHNTVRWNVEHPDRRCDALFSPDDGGCKLEGTLSALVEYVIEQERRTQKARA